jgi:HEAT repeat protein
MNTGIRPAPRGFLHFLCVTFVLFVCTAAVFAQAGTDLQIQALIQRLQDQDKQIRLAALKEAKQLGVAARAAIPTLALLLKEPADDVRESAAEALGRMGPEARTGTPALIEALKDRGATVRSNAHLRSVKSALKRGPAAPALGELLKDSHPWTRGNAAFALGRVGEAKLISLR